MDELKPCPFCGSVVPDVATMPRKRDHWLVSCSRCWGGGPPGKSEQHAMMLWNHRPTPAPPSVPAGTGADDDDDDGDDG